MPGLRAIDPAESTRAWVGVVVAIFVVLLIAGAPERHSTSRLDGHGHAGTAAAGELAR